MAVVYPKNLFRNSFKRIHKASCFVLKPFDPRFVGVFEVLRQTLQSPELNLICRRADDFRAPNILETILKHIAQSEYVIADLTDSNPNVFYELGIAHCIKDAENVVILAQSVDFVPFDLRHLRCVIYEQCPSGLDALRRELLATFQDASKGSFRFRVREGKRFAFAKKLVGRSNNLFDLTFECLHLGLDAIKLHIHFTEHSVDQPTGRLESQFMFLSEDQPSYLLDYIPWRLHLVQSSNQDALLALERDDSLAPLRRR